MPPRSSGQGYSRTVALHLIKNTARKRKAGALLECPRCRGREVIEAKIGVEIADGKPRGGTKVLLCACCHREGQRVALA